MEKQEIYVYAHWDEMEVPILMGTLVGQLTRGRRVFSFKYDDKWLSSGYDFILDPDIGFYSGVQYPRNKDNFGVFLDSMPDRWGRTLLKRREAQNALTNNEKSRTLNEIDYLLGVYDKSRMGGLRFKTDPDGPFLDDDIDKSIPPLSSLKELQHAVREYEKGLSMDKMSKWLEILIAPGTSLGGARPKANLIDEEGNLWIAKFPSIDDNVDKAAWEYLAYELAIVAGINMMPSKIIKVSGKHHTFLTKRFDRNMAQRIHFASAMTMTGNTEYTLRHEAASYLDIAEFIIMRGVSIEEDLQQLWRRIIFSIFISNTDDHLRNHGFLLTKEGWVLSPAYDINPSINRQGLSLNIDTVSNALSVDLSKSVREYFRLNNQQMDKIINEVQLAVGKWEGIADKIGIARSEQTLMRAAFNVE